MKEIILEANGVETIVFNVAEMAERFNNLRDTRGKRGKIYSVGMALTLVVLAKLAGEDKPWPIAEWIKLRKDVLVRMFNWHRQRVPCLNTIRGILQKVISLEELEKAMNDYLHQAYGGQQSQLVAIDGKTMRGTIPKGSQRGVHLLAAYLPDEGVVLKQVIVTDKENEITAAPQVIAELDLKQRIVCGDALQTQRQLSVEILAKGAEYLWFVKENHPTLHADVAQFFQPPQTTAAWPLLPCPKLSPPLPLKAITDWRSVL